MTTSKNPSDIAFDIQNALAQLPAKPGIYRMFGDHGELLYVGKAKVLKNRVRSYFQKNAGHTPRIQRMVSQIQRFDYVVTETEIEALILEDSLVKTHRPRYNVLLKDDKRYPWLCITDEPFPRLLVVRRIYKKRGKAKYFGPYINAGKMYETLKIIRKHFPLRQRAKPLFKERPCMNYSIGACPAPCQNLVTPEQYAETLQQVEWLLKGKSAALLAALEAEMVSASEALNFEWAAKLRDRYQAVQYITDTEQRIHIPDPSLQADVIGVAADSRTAQLVVVQVREGRMVASTTHSVMLDLGLTVEEAYRSFLFLHYQEKDPDELPDELVLQYALNNNNNGETETDEEESLLLYWLTHQRRILNKNAKKVSITLPQKGVKRDLLDFAIENAEEAVKNAQGSEASRLRADPAKALKDLQEALCLPRYPQRMECYDISHIQGSYTVASMVVFVDGQPDKSQYRKFKIKTVTGKPDDFQSMLEVITRRFKHSQGETEGWAPPDLVIIDGGKGQLSHAMEALESLGISDQPMISLAKKFEEVFRPGESRPVILPRDSAALFVLQQIRDESHRFAITFHRQLRGKGAKTSILDGIDGLGPKRKAKLLSVYGSVGRMAGETAADLMTKAGLPETVANAVMTAVLAEE